MTAVPIDTSLAVGGGALEAITRAEIDLQVATAKRYPRQVQASVRRALEFATADQETAAGCFYVLKRKKADGGQVKIEGPSIRLAEVFASVWGNLRWGARPISDDGKAVTIQGFAYDLETNVAMTTEVKRRITDRNGRRFSEDMVVMTANAGASIARRNALFGVVPRIYVEQVLRAAKKVAVGDVKSLTDRREKALAHFEKLGIERARVLVSLERGSVEDITAEDLEELQGVATAIRDGETTLEEAFPPPAGSGPAGASEESAADRLARELKEGKGGGPAGQRELLRGREPGSDG